MATPMTLSQTKFNSMMHIYEDDANIIKMPCPGLVEYIESGVLEGPVLDAYLEKTVCTVRQSRDRCGRSRMYALSADP